MMPRFRLNRASSWYSDEPIREEMFGVERMEDHARSLARAQAAVTIAALRGHSTRGPVGAGVCARLPL